MQPLLASAAAIRMLLADGLPVLALGLALGGIGAVFAFRRSRMAVRLLAGVAIVPAVISLTVVYNSAVRFHELATAATSPRPSELGDVVARALSMSFCGILATAIPLLVAIAVILRSSPNRAAFETDRGYQSTSTRV